MRPPRDWTLQNGAALALLLTSALAAAGVAQGETTAHLPDASPPTVRREERVGIAAPSAPAADPGALHRLVLRTVARNPFRADRSRPAGRYRLPGTGVPAPALTPPSAGAAGVQPSAAPPPRAPLPHFRLLGVAALAGGRGIAAIQVSGSTPRVVNVGDSIAGFRLVAVSSTEARLAGPDTTLLIRSSQPAP
ncbi:MAG TPA: hypothetical protein VHG28_08355 [Longimicrobiaceae bacterium]|nr:hypothetical protein [Longimicrobiaceae bacterium]